MTLTPAQILLTDECRDSLAKFTAVIEENETNGGGTGENWENARSYAVEAVTSLLRANPSLFDYAQRIDKIQAARRGTSG